MSNINPMKYIAQVGGWVKIAFAYVYKAILSIIHLVPRVIKKYPKIVIVLIFAIILGIIISYGCHRETAKNSQIDTLESEIKTQANKIMILTTERESLMSQIQQLKQDKEILQAKNDAEIKESGKNEYKKVMSLKDAAIIDYYNNVYRPGVVQRNAARSKANGGGSN